MTRPDRPLWRLPLPVISAMASATGRDFAHGWTNGLVRWHGRVQVIENGERAGEHLAGNPFDAGSVKYAASEAAVTFKRARGDAA